jgi:hypothetical protein
LFLLFFCSLLKNVEVEGFDSRVNIRTDGSIKENVPEGEDALGGSSAKQKKEQEKSENKSDQEETTETLASSAWDISNDFKSCAICSPFLPPSLLTPLSSSCPILKNVEVEGFDSRVNVGTDGSIKENVPLLFSFACRWRFDRLLFG